jgi:hypothetical protein
MPAVLVVVVVVVVVVAVAEGVVVVVVVVVEGEGAGRARRAEHSTGCFSYRRWICGTMLSLHHGFRHQPCILP